MTTNLIARRTLYNRNGSIYSDKLHLTCSTESYNIIKISDEPVPNKENWVRERFRLYRIKNNTSNTIESDTSSIIIDTQDITSLNKFTQIVNDTCYKNGKLHGNQKLYDHNAKLLYKLHYKKGNLVTL